MSTSIACARSASCRDVREQHKLLCKGGQARSRGDHGASWDGALSDHGTVLEFLNGDRHVFVTGSSNSPRHSKAESSLASSQEMGPPIICVQVPCRRQD